MITANINFDLIDTKRLFKGQKGRYLDLVLIETPDGKYGDYMVKQGLTKEEREAGVKMPILGNAKNFGGAPQGTHMRSPAGSRKPAPREPEPQVPTDDEIKF